MKRPRTTKKATARKPPRPHTRSLTQPAVPETTPTSTLNDAGVQYVTRLASALRQVMEAQSRWIPEMDAVSRDQHLIHDEGWQARITQAMQDMVAASAGFGIEPLPPKMEPVDQALGEARKEAQSAGNGFAAAVESADLRTMLGAVEHVDRMNQLIQRARSLIGK
jgi:uncharacterized protein (DUF4415 family)